jgi:protein associated with RNAse G/E
VSTIIQPARRQRRAMRVRSLKYDGSLNYEWPGQVVWEDHAGFIWFTPAGAPFTRPSGTTPVPYDWIGRVWYDHWYMVDASLLPVAVAGVAGVVHHYYCNIGAPGGWEDDIYRFVDLDLDVTIFPDGRSELLDEDEFAAHQVRFGYPDEVIAASWQSVDDVLALAEVRATPFDGSLAAHHLALHERDARTARGDERAPAEG